MRTINSEEIYTGKGKTIIDLFIEDELKGFKEPTRRGLKKGEKVGFPRTKMVATIYTGISDLKQKEIADIVGTTHAQIRLWNTEREFKSVAVQMRKKFEDFFDSNMIKRGITPIFVGLNLHPDIERFLLKKTFSFVLKKMKNDKDRLKAHILYSSQQATLNLVGEIFTKLLSWNDYDIKAHVHGILAVLLEVKRYQNIIDAL